MGLAQADIPEQNSITIASICSALYRLDDVKAESWGKTRVRACQKKRGNEAVKNILWDSHRDTTTYAMKSITAPSTGNPSSTPL